LVAKKSGLVIRKRDSRSREEGLMLLPGETMTTDDAAALFAQLTSESRVALTRLQPPVFQ
jgi:hypothetical protein